MSAALVAGLGVVWGLGVAAVVWAVVAVLLVDMEALSR